MRSGYAALAGRPNVGKSTLLNALLGQKLSITSRKPQTTRQRLLGIKNTPEAQILYVDTPGLHTQTNSALNRYMNRAAGSTLHEVDIIVFMVEALQWREEDEYALTLLGKTKTPVILAVNKIDKIPERRQILPYIEKLAGKFQFQEVFPISAAKKINLDALESKVIEFLPQGVPLFPAEQLTDRSERFLAAELIREKLMRLLGQEVPYHLSVEIEHFSEEASPKENAPPLLRISSVIWVERAGQKAIVIGKQGRTLKAVGTQARQDMERLFACKVFLQLWVKIKSGWSDDERALKYLGYNEHEP